MTVLETETINPQFIKTRWQEPYLSAGLNKKSFKTTPRGVYRGFEIVPGPGDWDITILGAPDGSVTGYNGGSYDAASGWSVAVHENIDGYTTTVAQQAVSAYEFDLTAYKGTSGVFCAIDVNYYQGFETTAELQIVDADELDADPTLLCLARINVPAVDAIPVSGIVYDDPDYPRIYPWATHDLAGFMSSEHVQRIEALETRDLEKTIGTGTGAYATWADALADAVAGDTFYVNANFTFTAPFTWNVSDIDIYFDPGVTMTWTAGAKAFVLTGDRVAIRGMHVVGDFAGVLGSCLEIDANDCDMSELIVEANDAGITVTQGVNIVAGSLRNRVDGAFVATAGTMTNAITDAGTDSIYSLRG